MLSLSKTTVTRLLTISFLLSAITHMTAAAHQAPSIVLMMADDLGFSDLGCYGSEIATPNLDQLAARGIRFTNFSNTSRCCPSRASLLTGLYSHQAGLGGMTHAGKGPGYQGQLRGNVATLPEVLAGHGYSTAMVGKWHLTLSKSIDSGPNGSWPQQRGFEKFFGSMEGAKNYFRPKWLFEGSREITQFDDDFFYTNAISEKAATWIGEQSADKPLFLYVAFYAPHFPLQAPQAMIDSYHGKYLAGWDRLRRRRCDKQIRIGLVPEITKPSERPDDVPAWATLSDNQRDNLDLRMATYAAQVDLLDQGVGRIVESLRQTNRLGNTLLIFLSDNGAAGTGGAFGDGPDDLVGQPDAPIRTTYGKGWATLSNTPYRFYKANTHEGGVMAPLILHWPARLQMDFRHDVAHIIDIVPTCLAAAGVDERKHPPEGIDLLGDRPASRTLFYEHEKSRAVRKGTWKLVNRGKSTTWELYDLSRDRTESRDLATQRPDQVRQLSQLWSHWAERCHVFNPAQQK